MIRIELTVHMKVDKKPKIEEYGVWAMGHEETLADDLLRGLRAIARFTGDSKSRTAALCEAGLIPVGKERGLWIASRRRLCEHYARLTAGVNFAPDHEKALAADEAQPSCTGHDH